MSGHFVLWRISRETLQIYQNLPGVAWSGLAHAAGTPHGVGGVFAGWNQLTRDELNRVRSSVTIGSRANLPPHRYLQFPPGAPGAAIANQLLADKYGWIADLERPFNAGFGITALAPAAAASWIAGQSGYKYDALVAQITHGATSVEVYYLGGKEMT